jgi:hypothetical protein
MLQLKKFSTFFLTAFTFFAVLIGMALAQGETQSVAPYRKVFNFQTPTVDVEGDVTHTVTFPVAPTPGPARVNYLTPPLLNSLLSMHIAQNDAQTKGPGFRVQIYAGSRMEFANEAKADFMQSFGDFDYGIYQMWQPPHFRVRVGDFLSRAEALREMATFRQVFPDAFIVEDEIILPKYKKQASAPEILNESPDGPEIREN